MRDMESILVEWEAFAATLFPAAASMTLTGDFLGTPAFAALEQQVDGVVVAALGGPLEGGGDGLAALLVDGRAFVEEKRAHGELVVDGGPLQLLDERSEEKNE